jgi:hypothetical protein
MLTNFAFIHHTVTIVTKLTLETVTPRFFEGIYDSIDKVNILYITFKDIIKYLER